MTDLSRPDGVDPPDGYPAGFGAEAALLDGSKVHIRPIVPADADRHRRFVHGLSRDAKYFRFFTAIGELSARDVDRFCTVDFHDRFALVALYGGEIVAVARWDRTDPDEAEVAFVVADAMQGKGIATMLLDRLADAARSRGISRFTAEVLAPNTNMLHVFRDAGYAMSEHFEGHGVIRVDLALAAVTPPRPPSPGAGRRP